MLYFDTCVEGNVIRNNRWRVGQKLGALNAIPECVTSIQADGDELELIRKHMTGIPMTNTPVVCWFGETAHFIAANLPGNR